MTDVQGPGNQSEAAKRVRRTVQASGLQPNGRSLAAPESPKAGWRSSIRARAEGLHSLHAGEWAEVDDAYEKTLTAARDPYDPGPLWRRSIDRFSGWVTAREARRYETALAALLNLRREVL